MNAAAGAESFGPVAKLLHWSSAVLVAALLCLGVAMVWLVRDLGTKFSLYQLHKSLGLTVLLLTLLRLAWRAAHPPPPAPACMAPWERRAAAANHVLLYLLLVAMPVSGWAMVSASTFPVPTVLFGWLKLPHIPALAELAADRKQALEPILKWVHFTLAVAMASLIALHLAAALRHHFVLRDGVLLRMWPRFSGLRRRAGGSNASGFLLVCGLGVTLAGGTAHAGTWTVDGGRSSLAFKVLAAGQTVRGRFERFSAHIAFEPADLSKTRIDVRIDTGSARTGQSQIDEAIAGADWFDVARYPEARFQASESRRTADGRFELVGTLTIRGATRPVVLPFSLALQSDGALARGRLTVDRLEFGVGPASLPAGMALGKIVTIELEIRARRSG